MAEATRLKAAPVASCALALKRDSSRPASRPAMNMATSIGSMSSPAWVMLAPKP